MDRREELHVKDIFYRYPGSDGGNFSLSIPNLRVAKGSITVLSGDNGSGKTTLLKILSGLILPDGGQITIPGSGYGVLVHQSPYLLRGSVERNVSYGLAVRHCAREERKGIAARCLEAVGLSGFEKRRSDKLSGGEKNRVAIARALAVDPAVLLLDEPTASVDKESVKRLEEIIRGIAERGTTIIITSHDSAFAYRIADTLIGIDSGVIVPPQINFLKGEVLRSDDRFSYFRTGDAEIRCVVQEGQYRSAVVPYNDVILSVHLLDSSAQNQFSGVVQQVVENSGRFFVEVDCGFSISSIVTGLSIESLEIKIGSPIYVIFKASSVRLY